MKYSTRSQSVVDRRNDLFRSFSNNPSTSDFAVIHEIWPRYPTQLNISFDSVSHPQPCIRSELMVDVQPRGFFNIFSINLIQYGRLTGPMYEGHRPISQLKLLPCEVLTRQRCGNKIRHQQSCAMWRGIPLRLRLQMYPLEEVRFCK